MIARLKQWTVDAVRNRSITHGLRSPLWPAKRAEHLKKFPNCAACGQTDHAQVHHVIPFHIDPAQELVDENLITLCEEKADGNHHFEIGHKRNWRSFNPDVRADAAEAYSRKFLSPSAGIRI